MTNESRRDFLTRLAGGAAIASAGAVAGTMVEAAAEGFSPFEFTETEVHAMALRAMETKLEEEQRADSDLTPRQIVELYLAERRALENVRDEVRDENLARLGKAAGTGAVIAGLVTATSVDPDKSVKEEQPELKR